MSQITDYVTITAFHKDATVTFLEEPSWFRELYVYAESGIIVTQDIATTNGDLSLTFPIDHGLYIYPNVDIVSHYGNVILQSNHSHIYAQTPSSIQASNIENDFVF